MSDKDKINDTDVYNISRKDMIKNNVSLPCFCPETNKPFYLDCTKDLQIWHNGNIHEDAQKDGLNIIVQVYQRSAELYQKTLYMSRSDYDDFEEDAFDRNHVSDEDVDLLKGKDYISNIKGSDGGFLTNKEALEVYPRDLIDAVQEAVISMACLIDDPDYIIKLNNEDTKNIVSDADLDHVNEQLLVIADRLKIGRNTLPMEMN
tara:strand:+ start:1222 stop:1833 length:612 start_codon:yes stop_codon:yes gene_type:complete